MAASFDGDMVDVAVADVMSVRGPLDRDLRLARALEEASFGLARRRPDLSALGGLTQGQRSGGWGLLGAASVWIVLDGHALVATFIALGFGIFSVVVTLRLAAAMAHRLEMRKDPILQAPDCALPTLTLLAPLYHEANMAGQIVAALNAIDYPKPLLDILLLIEANDDDTLSAFRSHSLPPHFRIVPVPHGEPRTKPRALNYGLALSSGEIVAVFDAEDRPSPDQARAAIAVLQNARPDLAAVQAPLLIHNGNANWLTRQFEIEYAAHFGVWLPFLARIGAPIALGGTSNYFRRSWLERVGGWDPWNVTEDADLGLRIARFGGVSLTIKSPTLEEAPVRMIDWMRQRTRWMKGHMQTLLVLVRRPHRAIAEMGLARFCLMQAAFGGSLLAACLHLPIMIWVAAGLMWPNISMNLWQTTLFGVGYGAALSAAVATHKRGRTLIDYVALPLGWLLQSVAAGCALWELKRRPHAWAKTPHGLGIKSSEAG